MELLIRTAWRAFWVGLGASAVLIAQSLTTAGAPAHPGPSADERQELVAPRSPVEPLPTQRTLSSSHRRGLASETNPS